MEVTIAKMAKTSPMGDDEETSLFTCDDGEEIYISWLNDDYNDCQGGEDEAQYDMGEEVSVFHLR